MPKERRQPSEVAIPPELARAFAGTFISRRDMYPVQRRDGSYVTLKRKLSLDLVAAHLQGFVTLGAYALDIAGRARWICLDADADEEWQGVFRLAVDLHRQSIPSYLEPSRRGGHLWLFMESLPGAEARRFGQQLLAEHGLSEVELYPKQDALKTGPGSLVRLPLGIHLKTNKRYPFVTLDGQPLAPTIRDQARLLANPQRVPSSFVHEVLARIPQKIATPEPPVAAVEALDMPLSVRIKRAVSVHQYVAQVVQLDERGRGHCPFHEDQHKSFSVNRGENYWHCFSGCGGGSIIDFAMRWRDRHGEDGSFTATIKVLAEALLPRSDGPETGS